jgi:hypothetical protein
MGQGENTFLNKKCNRAESLEKVKKRRLIFSELVFQLIHKGLVVGYHIIVYFL